jgi:hypothetical protein
MSMNYDENIDTFKTHGRQNVKQNFNQHLSEDAWTSYIDNLICDHFHFVIFHHLTFFQNLVLEFFWATLLIVCNVYG